MYFEYCGGKCVLNPEEIDVGGGYVYGDGMVFPYRGDPSPWGVPSEIIEMGFCNFFRQPENLDFYITTREIYDLDDAEGDVETEFYKVTGIPTGLLNSLLKMTEKFSS